jgi:hypothetical protein
MKALICFLLVVMAFWGCKKGTDSEEYQSQGVITGYDMRMCASPYCGGLFITIKNDTTKNAPQAYLAGTTLTALKISESTPFPINVSLNWKHDYSLQGVKDHIVVTKIKVNN